MYYGYFTRNYETWTHRGWGRLESESERGDWGKAEAEGDADDTEVLGVSHEPFG